MAWPRFDPAPQASLPAGTTVRVTITRPDDGSTSPFEAGYVGLPVFGNDAGSTSRCVVAQVQLLLASASTAPSGPPSSAVPSSASSAASGVVGPVAQTHCFRGLTYVR